MLTRRERQPKHTAEWLREIAAAFLNAHEAISAASAFGDRITAKDLFTIAPEVMIKFRGLRRTRGRVRKATEAALSSYVANEERHGDVLGNPRVSFAFAYLASHFGLDLLDEREVDELMTYIEDHQSELDALVQEGDRSVPQTAVADRYSEKQGQYLAYIYYYTKLNGRAPSEADMQRYFRVSPPTVHQMVLSLEKRGLIQRTPGQARSIRLLLRRDDLPDLD